MFAAPSDEWGRGGGEEAGEEVHLIVCAKMRDYSRHATAKSVASAAFGNFVSPPKSHAMALHDSLRSCANKSAKFTVAENYQPIPVTRK